MQQTMKMEICTILPNNEDGDLHNFIKGYLDFNKSFSMFSRIRIL